jgi:hypothetical protein
MIQDRHQAILYQIVQPTFLEFSAVSLSRSTIEPKDKVAFRQAVSLAMCGGRHEMARHKCSGPPKQIFLKRVAQSCERREQERANRVKKRDHKAEYARRKSDALAQGLSVSQARGHAKAGERPSRWPPRQIEDEQLQVALRVLRQEKNFEAAAKAVRISPERLRRHAVESALIEKSNRRWQPRFSAGCVQRVKRYPQEQPSDRIRGQVLDAALDLKRAASRASRFLCRCTTHNGKVKILSKLAEPADDDMRHVEGMRFCDAFVVLTNKERDALVRIARKNRPADDASAHAIRSAREAWRDRLKGWRRHDGCDPQQWIFEGQAWEGNK